MSKKRIEPTQTTPEGDQRTIGLPGEGGYEIPVPNRDTFLSNIEKVAPVAGEGVSQEAADSADQPDADATNEGELIALGLLVGVVTAVIRGYHAVTGRTLSRRPTRVTQQQSALFAVSGFGLIFAGLMLLVAELI